MSDNAQQGWAIWVVGMPGSGKSNLARALTATLSEEGYDVIWLQMDARRKAYFPKPTYSPEEREAAYTRFAQEAAELTHTGRNVIMDGSAYQVAMRRYARTLIPRFAEVHVQCTLENAMLREGGRSEGLAMAGLYAKAIERKKTGKDFPGLGAVIGVDVPFEEDPQAEFIIANDNIPKQETRRRTLEHLRKWLPSPAE